MTKKVGVGLIRFGRPEFGLAAYESLAACPVDKVVTVFDVAPVAKAKNEALQALLGAGCDWLFLMEDDIEVTDPKAVTGYLEAAEASGYDHLMFHAHGPNNPVPRRRHPSGKVTYWPNSVGAWCLYSRRSIETCGFFDEVFFNAWEHVEHSQRLSLQGFSSVWPDNADATGSEHWLREQPGALENSAIRRSPDWPARVEAGRQHWRDAHPESFKLIWP